MRKTIFKKAVTMGMMAVMALCVGGGHTLKADEKPMITEANIMTKQKVQLKGQNVDFKDQKIKLIGTKGERYTAKYNDKEKMFMIQEGEIGIGPDYALKLDFAEVAKDYQSLYIPCVLEVKLVSNNQLEVIFDKPVDVQSATHPANYWIRSSEAKAKGVASLGKDEKISDMNALKKEQVCIKPKDNTNKVMVMTFVEEATPEVSYSLIPCFINMPKAMGYKGGNFVPASKLDFSAYIKN